MPERLGKDTEILVDTGGGNELSSAIEEGSPKTKTRTSFHMIQLYHFGCVSERVKDSME